MAAGQCFLPIMRLHGQRVGGPCRRVWEYSELWTLAPDAAHYNALVAIVRKRFSIRNYTLAINAVNVASGLPMVRAMIAAFPGDGGCSISPFFGGDHPLRDSQIFAFFFDLRPA